MPALPPIDAKSFARRLKSRELAPIDIREPDEFAREHIDGAGLVFAGATGWCGMAKLLALMPWNRKPA